MAKATIAEELIEATGCKKKKSEDVQVYYQRLVRAVQNLDDDAWEGLSNAAQDWYQQNAEQINNKKKLNDLPGFVDESDAVDGKVAAPAKRASRSAVVDEDEEDEKPVKKASKKVVDEDEDEEDEKPVKKASKKAAVVEDEDEDEEPVKPAKKSAKKVVDEDADDEDEQPVKKSSKKVVEDEEEEEDKPVKKASKKAAVVEDEDEDSADEPEEDVKPVKKPARKAAAEEESEEEEVSDSKAKFSVGDKVTLVTKRGKTVKGAFVEFTTDDEDDVGIVIIPEGDEDEVEYSLDKLESYTLDKKPAKKPVVEDEEDDAVEEEETIKKPAKAEKGERSKKDPVLGSVTQRTRELVCSYPDESKAEISDRLVAEGYAFKAPTLDITYTDTHKTLEVLKGLKRLK